MPGTSKSVVISLTQWPIFGHMDRLIRPHNCQEYWMMFTELALSSLSTNPPILASIVHKTQIGGFDWNWNKMMTAYDWNWNKMMTAYLKSCYLLSCPAQNADLWAAADWKVSCSIGIELLEFRRRSETITQAMKKSLLRWYMIVPW